MQRFPKFTLPKELICPGFPADPAVQPGSELAGRIAFALELASCASEITLGYFRTTEYRVERKSDRSPVTAADKEAEQAVRRLVTERFPLDSILGEEFGSSSGTSEYEWIIDPIDGTKSFISGVPLYSTLVGMTFRGTPTLGVIAIPALGEICVAAKGFGAWYANASPEYQADGLVLRRTVVSGTPSLSDGLFLTSQVDNFERRQAMGAYTELERQAYVSRSWGDGYGYLLVATGRAELMVDPIVNPWDVAAVAPIIEEAGGRFTSWSGEFDIRAGHCLASNAHVHDAALSCLRPFSQTKLRD